jgi:predicted transcriptional regulator of viral defense system
MKGDYLSAILRSEKTIFTFKDIALIWQEEASPATLVRINYYIKKGELFKLRKGIYAKHKHYDRLELATRIFTPAYVSFESVLVREGLIFQIYESIFVASYLTREITIDGQVYSFRKIKDPVLTYPLGVNHENNRSLASKERAFLDTLYIHKNYHFDHLQVLDWEKVFEIMPVYENKRMENKVYQLFNQKENGKNDAAEHRYT